MVSERTGMSKQEQCEIPTIGREARGRGADKSKARRRVRVKGKMAVASPCHGGEALSSKKHFHGRKS